MAESKDPKRQRPSGPSGEQDDVYDLVDGEPAVGDDVDVDDAGSSGLGPRDADPFDEALGLDSEDSGGGDADDRPKPARPPVAPLPRIWKAPPEPTPEEPIKKAREEKADSRKTGKDAKKKEPEKGEGETNGVLLEETPALDTYEMRRTVRIAIGSVALGIGLIILFVVLRSFSPATPIDELNAPENHAASVAPPTVSPSPAPPAPAPSAGRELVEQEARSLLDRAHEAAKKGDPKLAVSLLTRVLRSYPNTVASRDAQDALERPVRNLPMFPDIPVALAKTSEPKPKTEDSKPIAGSPVAPMPPQATPAPAEVGMTTPVAPPQPVTQVSSVGPRTTPDAQAKLGRPLPGGFRPRPGTRVHPSGWALEILGDRDGSPMVLVPGGEFTMGRDDGDAAERPAHRVRLSTYYIDQHEVTVHQFDLFQKEAGRRVERARALAREPQPSRSDDSPVVMVSAKDAKEYATWSGKRLPSEAQWEKAARGSDGRPYPWGGHPPDWGKKREPRQINPVMSFTNDVSPFGAFDMAGNAWEWTKDWYDPRYFQLFKNQPADDPLGPLKVPPSRQVTVKGCAKDWIVTRREGQRYDDVRYPFLGFRCVLIVEGPDNAFQPAVKPSSTSAQPDAPAAPGMPGLPPPF